MAIKLRRGLNADRITITPESGEPLWTTDTKLLYIGDGSTVGGNLVGGGGTVTSVGMTVPSAFSVTPSTITTSGTFAVTGAGNASQYIRGDGTLAAYSPGSGGGGSSQTFYFNGSVASGVSGYQQMSTVANTGASSDFSISANGYIASFLTDVGSPNQLNIPAGNWNFEIYMNANSGGGTPSFYVELYKYASSTFTLIATSSANPEYITNGTSVDLYTTALSVSATVLSSTDRLAVRIYVTHSGRTITMHTQDSNLSEVITTFSTGLTALNGLTAQVQSFSTGTSGTDFAISSTVATHTFNLPTASATNRGALSSADWTTFNTAYTDRYKWDGGSTGLVAATGRTSLGATTLGSNLFTITNPSAITFPRYNADNTVSALDAAAFRAAIGAGTSSTTGTVTSVSALTLGTSGTDLTSTVATGTTTPVITLNVPTASATNRGVLLSTDWTTFNNKTDKLITANRQTASYTLVLTDADKIVEMNVATANNLTVPLNSSVAFSIGTQILLAQYGAGQTTLVPTSGVNIRSTGSKLKLSGQYSGATLIKIATDEWYLFGDITT